MLQEQKQELIEICAQMVLSITPAWCELSFSKKMYWIKVQLNQCGYVVETSQDGCIELVEDKSYPDLPEVSTDLPMPEVKKPKQEITLRDQLAMSAINGLIKRFDATKPLNYEVIVKMAYNIADEALKLRKENNELIKKSKKEKIQLQCFGMINCLDEEDECPECPLFTECKSIVEYKLKEAELKKALIKND